MISRRIAHQVATPRMTHETRTDADVAQILDETPLTRQLISLLLRGVACPGGQS